MRRRPLVPHAIMFVVLVALPIILAFAGNSAAMGAYLGGTAARLTDPLRIVLAVGLGTALQQLRFLVPALLVTGIGTDIYLLQTSWLGPQPITPLALIDACSAFLLVGFATHGCRLFSASRNPPSADITAPS